MNKKKVIAISSLILVALPTVIFALTLPNQPNPGKTVSIDIWTIINSILTFLWLIFVGVAIFMFIWAGFLFLTAHGDPTKISTARKAVIWGVVGVIVAMLAFSIVGF